MYLTDARTAICYLLLIGQIELLPQLYGQVLIQQRVQQELSDERSH